MSRIWSSNFGEDAESCGTSSGVWQGHRLWWPLEAPAEAHGGETEASGGAWRTVAEVARLVGMSERSARDWVKRHQLPQNEARPVGISERAVVAQMLREGRTERRPPEAPGGPRRSPEVPPNRSRPPIAS